jgi:hypothetical protein
MFVEGTMAGAAARPKYRQRPTLVNIVATHHIITVSAHISNEPEYILNRFVRLPASEHVAIDFFWGDMTAGASQMT